MTRLRWTRVPAEERGRAYVDHVAGPFRIAEGYDEPARRAGEPWTLLERGRHVATFDSLRSAQRHAEGSR